VPDETTRKREAEPTLMRDVTYIAFKRKYPLIALLLLGVLIIAYGSAGQKPEYEATARVMVERLRATYAMPAVTSGVLKRGEAVNSEIQIILSSAVAAEVVDRLGIAEGGNRGLAIETIQDQIRAKAPPEADIIDISYRHGDPEWAATVANAALEAYLEIRARIAMNMEAVGFLAEQARMAKAARDSVAAQIAKLGAESGDLLQGRLAETNMALKGNLRNERINVAKTIATKETELAALREWLDADTDYSHVPTDDIYEMGTVQMTYNRTIAVNSELADAQARYTEDHPDVQRLKRELESLKRLLRDEVERAYRRQEMRLFEWKAQLEAIDDLLVQLETEDEELGEVVVQRRLLDADLHARQQVYEVVLDRSEEYRITVAVDPAIRNVSVVSRAQIPARPTPRPVNMKVVVGAFTIIFGVLLVYALEKADHTLDRREDVHRFLGVKVLASIPERR